MSAEVVCVSAGMLRPKKADTPLARLHQYLNYGLLGLATILRERGYSTTVFHGGFTDPSALASRLFTEKRFETGYPLLVSLPSSFALAWARQFAAEAKALAPSLRIVIGGRWVTANDGAWIRAQIPHADLVVYGMAESRIEDLLHVDRWTAVSMTDRYMFGKSDVATPKIPNLNFALMDGFERYQPCVEISRGCGMGCSFCAEATVQLTEPRPPRAVAEALAQVCITYESGEVRPYFQASFFRPSTSWIKELHDEFRRLRVQLQWRAESRVDGLSPDQIGELARSGLAVLDLGLESASPQQLSRMKKTPNPSAYLRRASALLAACAQNGVWTKVNVLLFPGETVDTLNETRNWLNRHRNSIKGVSVGPMIVFRFGDKSRHYLQEISTDFGATPVNPDDLDRIGYTHVNPSAEISHEAAVAHSLDLSRELMTSNDYYDLKSFSYFPRGFRREDFNRIVESTDHALLPFRS